MKKSDEVTHTPHSHSCFHVRNVTQEVLETPD